MRRLDYAEQKAAGFPHRGLLWCRSCGGGYIQVGVSGAPEVPHDPACPRNPARAWPPKQQDREAAVLRDVRAPFPVPDYEPVHPIDCGCGCEMWNRGMK